MAKKKPAYKRPPHHQVRVKPTPFLALEVQAAEDMRSVPVHLEWLVWQEEARRGRPRKATPPPP